MVHDLQVLSCIHSNAYVQYIRHPLSDAQTCSVFQQYNLTLSAWSICEKDCGVTELRHRSRKVTSLPRHGGHICPTLTESEDCTDLRCPVDCAVLVRVHRPEFKSAVGFICTPLSTLFLAGRRGVGAMLPHLWEWAAASATSHRALPWYV